MCSSTHTNSIQVYCKWWLGEERQRGCIEAADTARKPNLAVAVPVLLNIFCAISSSRLWLPQDI